MTPIYTRLKKNLKRFDGINLQTPNLNNIMTFEMDPWDFSSTICQKMITNTSSNNTRVNNVFFKIHRLWSIIDSVSQVILVWSIIIWHKLNKFKTFILDLYKWLLFLVVQILYSHRMIVSQSVRNLHRFSSQWSIKEVWVGGR